ncbi:MAG: hypothetical protein K2Y22_09500 [Candidatus Obscuribacterales bacterium]|nr:hypothetical protein [Candidatus Obscuribacterales bacterium]
MKNRANIILSLILGLLAFFAVSNFYVYAPDVGQPGGPIDGLSVVQLKKFYEARDIFKKTFTVKEGLGPLYNRESCYSCHGFPGIVGNQGSQAVKAESIKSVTDTFAKSFPPDCKISAPKDGVVSASLAPALWGAGLIDAIPDDTIEDIELNQTDENLSTTGTSVSHRSHVSHQDRIGKFGYKNQYTSLLDAVVQQMSTELGLTSRYQRSVIPDCLRAFLPEEPNDNGSILAKLNYFLALTAPPKRGKINEACNRGRVTFEKLGCAQCHIPTLQTGPQYIVLDPDSQFPTKRYLRITALENREVNAYSDLLLHDISDGVSDGRLRTAPLWGLRFRKYYLHDGRTNNLEEAISAHAGQAQSVKEKFSSLDTQQKADLLAFLKSL